MARKMERRSAAIVTAAAQTSGHDRLFGTSADFPRLVELDLDRIDPNPAQPRKHFDPVEIDSLAQSIAQHGLKQPVLVQEAADGRYVLVAGERRLRAHRLLGKPTIYAIITEGDPAELAVIENLQRVDLDAFELADGLNLLLERHGYTHEELGGIIARSQAEVTRTLRLLDLPEEIRRDYTSTYRHIAKSVLMEIAATEGDDQRLALWQAAKDGATVKQIRTAKKERQAPSPAAATRPAPAIDLALSRSLRNFGRHLTVLRDREGRLSPEERHRLQDLRRQLDEILGRE